MNSEKKIWFLHQLKFVQILIFFKEISFLYGEVCLCGNLKRTLNSGQFSQYRWKKLQVFFKSAFPQTAQMTLIKNGL